MSGGWWVASYVALWAAVLILGFFVVALLRQVGVLHARLAPIGGHPGGEGPELDQAAPSASPDGYRAPFTVVAFTSPTCEICAELRPSLRALARQYGELAYTEFEFGDDTTATFNAFRVRSTPYVVVVDDSGLVRARGVVNSLEQVEEMLLDARERAAGAASEERTNGSVAHD